MSTVKSPERYDHLVSMNVDIQNSFCPGGTLGVHNGDEVVQPMNNINQYVRDNSGTVIFTRDWHPRATNHFNTHGGPWPPHCIAYTSGAAFHDDLIVDTERSDLVASKGTKPDVDDYSGLMAIIDNFKIWNGREFDDHISVAQLLRYGIGHALQNKIELRTKKLERVAIIVGGLATDYCVKATVLDILALQNPAYDVFVIEDAMRAVNVQPHDGEESIAEMVQAGAQVIQSSHVPDFITTGVN